MENKKYIVIRLDSNCSDIQYLKLSELLNNGYFIYNEYRLTDIIVIILKLEENEGLSIKIDHEKINRIIENQSSLR